MMSIRNHESSDKLKNIQPATVVMASLKKAIPTGMTTIVTIRNASDIKSQ